MAAKLLAGFSLLWIVIGCILGFILGVGTPQYTANITRLAGDNDLTGVVGALLERTNTVSPHSHWLCLSMVTLAIALLVETKIIRKFSEETTTALALVFIVIVVMTTGGSYLHVLPLQIVGDGLFTAMCLIWFFGIVLKPKGQNQ